MSNDSQIRRSLKVSAVTPSKFSYPDENFDGNLWGSQTPSLVAAGATGAEGTNETPQKRKARTMQLKSLEQTPRRSARLQEKSNFFAVDHQPDGFGLRAPNEPAGHGMPPSMGIFSRDQPMTTGDIGGRIATDKSDLLPSVDVASNFIRTRALPADTQSHTTNASNFLSRGHPHPVPNASLQYGNERLAAQKAAASPIFITKRRSSRYPLTCQFSLL
jgi:hypothetical protein